MYCNFSDLKSAEIMHYFFCKNGIGGSRSGSIVSIVSIVSIGGIGSSPRLLYPEGR